MQFKDLQFDYKTGSNLKVRRVSNWEEKLDVSTYATVITAILNNEEVGQILIHENWIHYFVIHPEYRHNVLGSELLVRAEKLISKDYRFAFLHPQDNREDLIQFYSIKGYKVIDSKNNMKKELYRI